MKLFKIIKNIMKKSPIKIRTPEEARRDDFKETLKFMSIIDGGQHSLTQVLWKKYNKKIPKKVDTETSNNGTKIIAYVNVDKKEEHKVTIDINGEPIEYTIILKKK